MTVKITDAMVEQALTAEHDQVGRNYEDKPFWFSGLEHSERVRAHDGMRAALEALAPDLQRDEYHTMEELYEYRMLYNALAARHFGAHHLAEKSWRHHDGELCFGGGWFIVGIHTLDGWVTNHYEAKHWDLFDVPERETGPEWDGHTPAEAARRLRNAL